MQAQKPVIFSGRNASSRQAGNLNARDADIKKLGKNFFSYQRFDIFTHKNPDGDAIGSMLALEKILSLEGKAVEMFVFDSIDRQFHFLPGFGKIKAQKEFSAKDDSLFVFVDCHSPERTGFERNLFSGKESVAIDHHLVSGRDEQSSIKIIDPAASSTAEIIFSLADKLGWKIERDAALCLLAGILSDTGTFQHANTSPESLRIVSRLVQSGVNLKKIADSLFQKKETGGPLKIWGEILRRAAVDKRTGMAFSFVSENDFKKYNAGEENLGGLVNLLSGIPESKFSLLLVENKFGKIKASLRSESYKDMDVAKIARAFGGGGHKLAAGFEVEGRLESEMELIKEKIAKEIGIQ